MKQIMDRAEVDKKDEIKKERNSKLKETAKKLIVREEKQIYKGKYTDIVRQREEERRAKLHAQEDDVHDIMMQIKIGKD